MPVPRTACVVAAVPIVAASLAFATVGCCYWLTMRDPTRFVSLDKSSASPMSIQPGVVIPCISFLGVSGTARTVYQIGFGTTAALMLLCIRLSFVYIGPELTRSGSGVSGAEVQSCIHKGYCAALGVGMQGIFTLTPVMGPGCYIHWAGAAVFAAGAQSHAMLAMDLYGKVVASKVSPALHQPGVSKALEWRKQCLQAPQNVRRPTAAIECVNISPKEGGRRWSANEMCSVPCSCRWSCQWVLESHSSFRRSNPAASVRGLRVPSAWWGHRFRTAWD